MCRLVGPFAALSAADFLTERTTIRMAVFSTLLTLALQALTFLFFLLIVAFLAYCLYVKHIHMKYDHVPGPPRDR